MITIQLPLFFSIISFTKLPDAHMDIAKAKIKNNEALVYTKGIRNLPNIFFLKSGI